LSGPVRRDYLADAGDWSRGVARRHIAVALCVVTGAHLLLLLRFPALPGQAPAPFATPAVSLDLAPPSFRVFAMTPAPDHAAPVQPSTAAPPTAKTPPAAPSPQPPQPAPDPTALATDMPPLDLTAEPVQVTPSPAQAPTGGPLATTPISASTCDLTQAMQAALQNDPAVRDELALIPRQARSVANAIQLWDGAWVDAGALGGPAIVDPLRAAIVAVVSQAPAGCHDQAVLGPRLFAIVDPRGTIVVALGSGLWKWSDLLAPPGAGVPAPPR